ncbi:hypothetical protein [Kribbella deserti]|uniref:Uncharacterized protein n=1 Tax=Kribbella deserti TaxID=1926257 RepID=A0ABV6QK07_9ACTN
MSPADLQAVLLDVSRSRAAKVTPARLMQRRAEDRFVQPAQQDPRRLARTRAALWEALPERFEGVELSPVAPLGVTSAVSTVPQNNVLSTIRGTEVASDPTNNLALEAAVRRKAGAERVDLATCQRVVRTQALDGPGLFAHFELFALVSSRRDLGSGRAEAEMLLDHLGFWRDVLGRLVPDQRVRLTFTTFPTEERKAAAARGVVRERILDTVQPAIPELAEDVERTKSAAYYDGTALGVACGDAELGDGGFTRWTGQLLGNAKERCLTSCISIERLTGLLP